MKKNSLVVIFFLFLLFKIFSQNNSTITYYKSLSPEIDTLENDEKEFDIKIILYEVGNCDSLLIFDAKNHTTTELEIDVEEIKNTDFTFFDPLTKQNFSNLIYIFPKIENKKSGLYKIHLEESDNINFYYFSKDTITLSLDSNKVFCSKSMNDDIATNETTETNLFILNRETDEILWSKRILGTSFGLKPNLYWLNSNQYIMTVGTDNFLFYKNQNIRTIYNFETGEEIWFYNPIIAYGKDTVVTAASFDETILGIEVYDTSGNLKYTVKNFDFSSFLFQYDINNNICVKKGYYLNPYIILELNLPINLGERKHVLILDLETNSSYLSPMGYQILGIFN